MRTGNVMKRTNYSRDSEFPNAKTEISRVNTKFITYNYPNDH